ncbi:isopentenyl-diphosphate delta-isomerase [Alkalibacterium subtropicum]|uniref:Isopentenyl-diphosphate delta-isomerase n=1 Tax=Alkalibacterium subtropicum TaxID=753702 RepID=A0A1I1I1V0_9LACT|nr:type 2 isopentenyl-diphosphate Delta-isomerase [Alkalibacterium subtropicum]SFC29792.1 isopentenyl-diphosphate delta-isomerase [Alkalibacterium subtropicum]
MPKTNNRKNEHVSLSEKFYKEGDSSFKDIAFVHHSFPQCDVKDISLDVSMLDLPFTSPFFINAMSGGSTWTGKVNEKLAVIARETNLAMATGSVSAALKDPSQADTFQIVRKTNPNGVVFANLGAGHGLENAKRAVDLLDADALQIHLNAPQEIVMPEGDREFSDWIENIQSIVEGLDRPVIVKEVGFGMSRETVQLLESIGVKLIDISGKGGTNFAQIENYRRKDFKLDDFEAWGQSTVASLLEAQESVSQASLIASGGIRRPMEIVKALALGASLSGLSSQIMHMALDDVDQTIQTLTHWKEEIKRIMTLLGAKTIEDLKKTDIIITGDSAEWCEARAIDKHRYAFRSNR